MRSPRRGTMESADHGGPAQAKRPPRAARSPHQTTPRRGVHMKEADLVRLVEGFRKEKSTKSSARKIHWNRCSWTQAGSTTARLPVPTVQIVSETAVIPFSKLSCLIGTSFEPRIELNFELAKRTAERRTVKPATKRLLCQSSPGCTSFSPRTHPYSHHVRIGRKLAVRPH